MFSHLRGLGDGFFQLMEVFHRFVGYTEEEEEENISVKDWTRSMDM